jgi:hypothetical protein
MGRVRELVSPLARLGLPKMDLAQRLGQEETFLGGYLSHFTRGLMEDWFNGLSGLWSRAVCRGNVYIAMHLEAL